MVSNRQKELLGTILEHRAREARRRSASEDRPGLLELLLEIRRAQMRLRSDLFGYCEGCQMTIPWRDLTARPERRRCERCESTAPRAPERRVRA
jgi:RNA polymerase-binding transcription factor DksA